MMTKMKKPMRGADAVTTVIHINIRVRPAYQMEKLTAHKSVLEALGQTQMRRPQSVLELGESLVVVLAFQIADDALQELLDALDSGV